MSKKDVVEFEYGGETYKFKVPNKRPFEKIKDYGEFTVHAWADQQGIGEFNVLPKLPQGETNAFSELGESPSIHRVPVVSEVLDAIDPLH